MPDPAIVVYAGVTSVAGASLATATLPARIFYNGRVYAAFPTRRGLCFRLLAKRQSIREFIASANGGEKKVLDMP